ncbi:MAG TPA: hypothetical protein VEU08_12085 [Vicinamibacterales bacterium]|nr:hypothetical protein [Vicinamibacterales bacterium]
MGAFAALVAGAATSRHDVPQPIIARPAAVDLRGADLAKEIARLHERLRPDAVPRQPARNLFSFHAPRPDVAPPAAAPTKPALVEAPPPAPVPSPFKLVGMGEDPGPNGPVRTAFISAEGQLYVAKEGDVLTPRFKVSRIAADVVEITDVTDGSTRRLALK